VTLGFEIYAGGEWLSVGIQNPEDFFVDALDMALCPPELGPSVMKVRRHALTPS
jgi:hypothetical protein